MNNEEAKEIKYKKLRNLSIWEEWKSFGTLFLRPLTFITAGIAAGALYFANAPEMDKTASFILQIASSILLAIAGGSFYDAFKGLTGSTLLEKKGDSAVRNLSLVRLKIKNISYRIKEEASPEETRNSLSLLEKDIANATQEWNDILPGVDRIEEIYTVLEEKEYEYEVAEKEKTSLNEKIKKLNELETKEKGILKTKIEEKEKEVLRLSQEIEKLRLTTTSFPLSGFGLGSYIPHSGGGLRGLQSTLYISKVCSKCGKEYISYSLLDSNECDTCKGLIATKQTK